MKFAHSIVAVVLLAISNLKLTLQHINISSDVINFDSTDVEKELQQIIKCTGGYIKPRFEMRGPFWVLYNYVPATMKFKCYESVTYTTHADFTFMDNIVQLANRWNGPISIAVYAPGTDFNIVKESIAYFRQCSNENIKKLVTWHIAFDTSHFPDINTTIINSYNDFFDCTESPPYLKIKAKNSYKSKLKLTYPINVVRNVARLSANTHFVFASDIELYPTPNLSQKFISMILREPALITGEKPRVFVLPLFEILENYKLPSNKTELQEMLNNDTAVLFHEKLCKMCHSVPHIKEWVSINETEGLNVFVYANNIQAYKHWEPFYIGTQDEPLFDERLTWEGQSNKISQAYSMCLLDYDFLILDNAFLIHKPGIKKLKVQMKKYVTHVIRTNRLLAKVIKYELLQMYGDRDGCKLR